MKTEFKTIPIVELHESPHNPRQHVDATALQELVESIHMVGVLTPLLVRPDATGYEIAAGHRRYRASKLAGLTEVPCLVRKLTDEQFMEILTIENLQREDVHPLDEAKGYKALMSAPYCMPVEKIAARVGRSVKYIYDRVKLLDLSKEAQQLFWDGRIEAGHAILLARLTTDDQRKVIGGADRDGEWLGGGLFEAEHVLFNSDDEEERHLRTHGQPYKAVSVRELDRYIKEHVRFNATLANPFLYPETAQKVVEAMQDKLTVIEITREYLAGDDVRKDGGGKIYGERAWKRADGNDGSKTCGRAVLGVVVCGPGQGEAFFVCTNKEHCQIHWGQEIKAREQRRKALAQGGAVAERARTSQAKQEARWERERQEEQAREARYKTALPTIVAAVVERVKALPAKPTGCLADLVTTAVVDSGRRVPPGLPRGKSFESWLRHLAAQIVLSKAHDWGASRNFSAVAKRIGLDLAPFLAEPGAAAQAAGKLAKKKARRAV